jgi:hypothetical protein
MYELDRLHARPQSTIFRRYHNFSRIGRLQHWEPEEMGESSKTSRAVRQLSLVQH